MYRFLFILILQLSAFNLYAAKDSSTKKAFQFHKLILGAETGLKFISSDLNFQKQGFDLGLNLSYYTNNITYFGVFYNQMNDVWNTSDKTFLLDQNIVNISTANFNNFGVLAGYRMIESKKLIIMPELRVGYGGLAFKSINSEKIENVRMLTFDPRVNFGYKFTNSTIMGLTVSYLIPSPFEKKRYLVNNYNLNSAGIGAYLKIPLGRKKNQNKNEIPTAVFLKDTFQMSSVEPDSSENEPLDSSYTNDSIYNRDIPNSNDTLTLKRKSTVDDTLNSKISKRDYTIVIASFKLEKNAQKFLAKHNARSNNKYSLEYNEDVNRFRVTYHVFETRFKVLKILKNTRKKFRSAWIVDFYKAL